MKIRFFLFILSFSVLVSCNNLNSEYEKKIEEAFAPVKDKYEFAEKIYNGFGKKSSCITEINDTRLTDEQKTMLSQDGENEKKAASYSENQWLILHNKAQGGDDIGDNKLFGDGDYSYKKFHDVQVVNKDGMESYLDQFNHDLVNRIKDVKYLVVVTDEVFIRPKVVLPDDGMYSIGQVISNVKIYNIETKKEIGSFDVISYNGHISSSNVKENTLIVDLYKNHKNNIMVKATEMVQN